MQTKITIGVVRIQDQCLMMIGHQTEEEDHWVEDEVVLEDVMETGTSTIPLMVMGVALETMTVGTVTETLLIVEGVGGDLVGSLETVGEMILIMVLVETVKVANVHLVVEMRNKMASLNQRQ
jgi:hypothetical protein